MCMHVCRVYVCGVYCACVYLYSVCTCAGVLTYTGMCTGQRLMLGCFPLLLLCVIVWGAILTGWAYLQPLGSACFHALSHIAGVTGRLCHVQLFMWVLGIRTQVSMLGH